MRKPWEAPDLRHLQDRRLRNSGKSRAEKLAEALLDEPPLIHMTYTPDLSALEKLFDSKPGGVIEWKPSKDMKIRSLI